MTKEKVLPNRIREFRLALGWSPEDLADKVTESGTQLSRDHLIKLETGERQLTQKWMAAIAPVLDRDAADLLPDRTPGNLPLTPRSKASGAKGGPAMKPETLEIAEISDRLDPARRAALRHQAWKLMDEVLNEGVSETGPTKVRR